MTAFLLGVCSLLIAVGVLALSLYWELKECHQRLVAAEVAARETAIEQEKLRTEIRIRTLTNTMLHELLAESLQARDTETANR